MSAKSELRAKIFRTFLKNRSAVIGTIVILIIAPLAVVSPWISPQDPIDQDMDAMLQAPSTNHVLGTDSYGRDMFSRILVGSRISLSIGLLSILFGMLVGTPFGIIAGYYGGKVDLIITRGIDILMSFPTLLMGLMVLAVLGPGMINVIISIAIAFTPRFARMARAPTISVKEQDMVTACRAIGMKDRRIMFRHILPNIVGDIIVMGTLWTATAIRLEANLSFIGIGVQPPTPSWGIMIRNGVNYLTNAPWISLFTGLAIMITILSLNMLGDGLRDMLDPKLRS